MSWDFRYLFMPYCLDRQPDGRYAVLNRKYKPLGFDTQEWVDYADYPILVSCKALTPDKAGQLSVTGSTDIDRIYLYDDSTIPTQSADAMRAYLTKLGIFAKLKAG